MTSTNRKRTSAFLFPLTILIATECQGLVLKSPRALSFQHDNISSWRAPDVSAAHHSSAFERRCANLSPRNPTIPVRHASTSDIASPTIEKSLVSASAFVLLDIFFRRLLRAMSISFPSSLAGCGVLFATMLALPQGEKIYNALSPGSALLAKWLPLFFVPSLITLPLSDGLDSAMELAKVAVVVIGGFYFTLLSTAGSVLGIRKLLSSSKGSSSHKTPGEALDSAIETAKDVANETKDAVETSTSPSKPFSDPLANRLKVVCTVLVASAVATSRSASDIAISLQQPTLSAFLLSMTAYSFVFGARLPKKFSKVVHPLVTCTALTWTSIKFFGLAVGRSFRSLLRDYLTNSLQISATGAGDILLFLLGPAVVSLACQMFDRRKLMKANIAEVGTAVAVSAFGGFFGTAALTRLLDIGNPLVRLSLLSRNITSPLAMAIASIIGADVSLAVSMVVVTGLFGANFGASILDLFGIKDSVARGLGIGAAAHGLGTAAFANEKDAFPFAAIAMALTASACTVLVSMPLFKRLVIQLALGV